MEALLSKWSSGFLVPGHRESFEGLWASSLRFKEIPEDLEILGNLNPQRFFEVYRNICKPSRTSGIFKASMNISQFKNPINYKLSPPSGLSPLFQISQNSPIFRNSIFPTFETSSLFLERPEPEVLDFESLQCPPTPTALAGRENPDAIVSEIDVPRPEG